MLVSICHKYPAVDKNAVYPKAIDKLKQKQELPELVELRQNNYLNNIEGVGGTFESRYA